MKLCCKTSFQQTHDKLLFTSSISNGHAHSSEKASEQASLLSCEYLFGTLLAQKRMTRRKRLHLMPLLPCYSQSCQSAAESKCHPAQLRGLVSSGTETLGHLVSLCLQDLKQKWWSSQPQNKPLMISLYNYKLTFSLSHQLFWWSALVCCLLGKKKSPTKLPLETNTWGKIKPYFGLTSTFLTLLTQLQERGFFQFTHQ